MVFPDEGNHTITMYSIILFDVLCEGNSVSVTEKLGTGSGNGIYLRSTEYIYPDGSEYVYHAIMTSIVFDSLFVSLT